MRNAMGSDTAKSRRQTFEELVNVYQEAVLRMCFLYLRDKSAAEDAAQETFLRIYRSMDTFRGESSPKTWVMKIAIHVCCDMNRSGWFRFVNRRITPEMLPASAVDRYDMEDEVLTVAVMKLPRKMREVILLYYYQELKVREIAEVLHIHHASVSGRLKRGRERLKKLLEGRELDE